MSTQGEGFLTDQQRRAERPGDRGVAGAAVVGDPVQSLRGELAEMPAPKPAKRQYL